MVTPAIVDVTASKCLRLSVGPWPEAGGLAGEAKLLGVRVHDGGLAVGEVVREERAGRRARSARCRTGSSPLHSMAGIKKLSP